MRYNCTAAACLMFNSTCKSNECMITKSMITVGLTRSCSKHGMYDLSSAAYNMYRVMAKARIT